MAAGADQVSSALSVMAARAASAQSAIDQLFRAGDSSALRSQVTARINEIAGAAAKAGRGARGAVEDFNKALKDTKDPLGQQVKALKAQRAINERVNSSARPRGGGRATSPETTAQGELKQLQLREKQAELFNRRESEALRNALQDRLISLVDYTTRAEALERQLLAAKLRVFDQEEETARRTSKNRAQADARVAEVQLQRQQAEQEAASRIQALRDDQRRTEERAEEDHQRRLVDIRDVARRAEEAAIRDAVSRGQIGAVAGEQRLIEIERQRDILREAEQLKEQARQAQLGAEVLLQIEQNKNAALKAERERAAVEQQQLLEQQRAVQIAPGFGEQAAAAIAGIEAALERQLTLWEQNRVALGLFTQDLRLAAEDAWARATDVLGNFTNALNDGIDAFVASGGSLFVDVITGQHLVLIKPATNAPRL